MEINARQKDKLLVNGFSSPAMRGNCMSWHWSRWYSSSFFLILISRINVTLTPKGILPYLGPQYYHWLHEKTISGAFITLVKSVNFNIMAPLLPWFLVVCTTMKTRYRLMSNYYMPHKWIVLFARADWLARSWLATTIHLHFGE